MDPYPVDQCSSSDGEDNESLSSDDELINRMKRRHSNDVEIDEFEREMNNELDQVISGYQQTTDAHNVVDTSSTGNPSKQLQSEEKETSSLEQETAAPAEPDDVDGFYDESYFSSGSEDDFDKVGGEKSKSKSRRRVPTNEELFYDPDMDDEDEQWMNKQRQHYRQAQQNTPATNTPGTSQETSSKLVKKKVQTVPSSDAILACPACMTTLCIDCQRHELYKMQYRAMFVLNCTIARDERLRYEESQAKGKWKNRKKQKGFGKLVQAVQPGTANTTEVFHPVKCAECGTEVAVLDKEEVYHFFNVVESLA